MLIEQAPQQNVKWLNLSRDTGKFHLKIKDKPDEEYSVIQGYFNGVKISTMEWKDQKIEKLVIVLTYDNNTYEIQVGFKTFAALQLLNRLATITDTYSQIQIGAFKSDDNIQVYIKQEKNGVFEPLGWKYDVETLKKAKVYGSKKTAEAKEQAIQSLYDIVEKLKPLNNDHPEEAVIEENDESGDDIPF